MNKFIIRLLVLAAFTCVSKVNFAQNRYVTLLTDAGSAGEFGTELQAAGSGDTVFIDVKGTVMLTTPISMNGGVVVVGPNPIHFKVDGSGLTSSRMINVAATGGASLDMIGVGFENAVMGVFDIPSGVSLNVKRCLFEGNSSTGAASCIFSNGGNVNVYSSSFIGNSTNTDGGVMHLINGSNNIINSTFFNNTSGTGNGGAISTNGGVHTIQHCTFYNNTANYGQAISPWGGTFTFQNNIFHTDLTAQSDMIGTGGGPTMSSAGGNIVKATGVPFTMVGTDDVSSAMDPYITGTVVTDGYGMKYNPIINPSSPAINVGGNSALPAYDARLSHRILEVSGVKAADAGAIEYSRHIVTHNGGGTSPNSLGGVIQDISGSSFPPYSIVFDMGAGPYAINAATTYILDREVTLNGYTQEGSSCPGPGIPGEERTVANPIVQVVGGIVSDGFLTDPGADNSVITGLTINSFSGAGIKIQCDAVKLEANHIGVNVASTGVASNDVGVMLESNPDDVIVGGSSYTPGTYKCATNVISGNATAQILVSNGYGHYITNNFIGLDGTGVNVVANPAGATGIEIISDQDHIIGGDLLKYQNVIGGVTAGIHISGDAGGSATGTKIIGNIIGLGVDGSTTLANEDGVNIGNGVQGVKVGGDQTGEFNVISGNSAAGVLIDGGSNNIVMGNYIGLDYTGNFIRGNGKGVELVNGATTNQIGGTGANQGNVIANNTISGIELNGTTGNAIYCNIIGLSAGGVNAHPNGIGVNLLNDAVETIGGGAIYPNAGNLISGNNSAGIYIQSSCTAPGINIYGNVIGLQEDLSSAVVGNPQNGIIVDNTAVVEIGDGTVPNIISGNNAAGKAGVVLNGENTVVQTNYIGIDASGNPQGNEIGVYITGSTNQLIKGDAPQVISANTAVGVLIQGGVWNVINGNHIGTDASGGSAGYGNGKGIRLESNSTNNVIGSALAGSNIISGNDGNGIEIDGGGSINNQIVSNYIGIDASGSALGNGDNGIFTNGCGANDIGDNGSIQGTNVISGNVNSGIHLTNGTSNVAINNNFIGTNSLGSAAIGNVDGIKISNSMDNFVGDGASSTNRNLISGNTTSGILIEGSLGTQVEGNLIGINLADNASLGGQDYGVIINSGSESNVIGGNTTSMANTISGNLSDGVLISGASTHDNLVQRNNIGTNSSGNNAIANGEGVTIENSAYDNFIGGTFGAESNVISGNTNSGVLLTSGATGNVVEGNVIGPNSSGGGAVSGGTNQIGVEVNGGANGNFIGFDASTHLNIISGNQVEGILISGTGTDNNEILGNFIGTNLGGTGAFANTRGIKIEDGASGTKIGGDLSVDEGNLISGNTQFGIIIDGSSNVVNNTTIYNNAIGTNDNVNGAIPNGIDGINALGVTNLTIGGTGTNQPNAISGNTNTGITVQATSTNGVTIMANYIGVDFAGTNAIGNGGDGILVQNGADNVTIGGDSGSGEGNVISGNGTGVNISSASNVVVKGNNIGVNAAATGAIPNNVGVQIISPSTAASSNQIGGTGAGEDNIITGNTTRQVAVIGANSTNNTILGNFIGINNSNTDLTAAGASGIVFDDAGVNLVGGSTAAERNIISGLDTAIVMYGATGVNVFGNYIGTNTAGTSTIQNIYGVFILDASDACQIGSSTSGEGNLIGGYTTGVHIYGTSTSNNVVEGNLIGTDNSGMMPIFNSSNGVKISNGASLNKVGPNNVISGHTSNGVTISGTGTDDNAVEGNFIGTDATGNGMTAGIENAVGVVVESNAAVNNIGSSSAGNVISANTSYGIMLTSNSNTTGVFGNHIGVGADGTTSLGNSTAGIYISNGSTNNQIGGSSAGQPNTIANNGRGISTGGSGSNLGNNFEQNSIHSNANAGIDLASDGVTANDVADSDAGDNALQNYPVITSAFECGTSGVTSIGFNCDFVIGQNYRIEFFTVNTGERQGKTYLESATVTVSTSNEAFSHTLGSLLPVGTEIVATATDLTSFNTSEFSEIFTATGGLTTATGLTGTQTICEGDTPASLTGTSANNLVWYTDDPPTIANYVGGGSPLSLGAIASAGSYVYYAYDSTAGCYGPSSSVTITVNPLPTITLGTSPEVCIGTTSANLPYTGTTGSPDQYSIDFDATAEAAGFVDVAATTLPASPIVLTVPAAPTAATYNATITPINSSTGCSGTAVSFTVTVNGNPDISGNNHLITHVDCFGNSTGAVNVDAGGMVATPSFSWSGPGAFSAATEDISGVAAGTYTLNYTDGNGCSNSINFTINQPAAALVADAGTDVTVCQGDMVTLSGTATGGTPTYSYAWNNGVTDGTPFAASVTTTYTLTVTDANSCTDTDDITVTVNPTPTADAGVDISTCANNLNVNLSGAVTNATGGAWSGGTGSFSPNNTDLNASYTPSAAEITAGTVTLTLTTTGTGACTAVTDDVIITINPSPVVSAGVDQTVCANNASVTLAGSITNATGGTWTGGTGTFSTNANDPIAVYTPSASEITAGTVTLTLTSTGNGNCTAVNDDMTITITPAPTVDAGTNQTECEGTAFNLGATFTVATGMTWSTSGDGTFSNATDPNAVYTPGTTDNAGGAVTLTATTTGNGTCSAESSNVTLTINPAPVTPSVTGSSPVCANATGTTYSVSNTVGSSYVWTVPTGATITAGAGTNTITVDWGTTGGNVSVIETSSNSCVGTSVTYNVTVNANPSTSVISGNNAVCENAVGEIYSVANTAGSSYAWTVPTGATITAGAGTNSITVTFGSTGGTVEVTETSANGCAGTPVNIPVTVESLPVTSLITGTMDVCENTTGVVFSVSGTAGNSYSWTVPTGATITAGAGTNSITVDFGTGGGTLGVVESTASGCAGVQVDTTINVITIPTFGVTFNHPTTCGGNDGEIYLGSLLATTTYDVTYENDGSTIGPNSMTSGSSGGITISGLNAGSYTNFNVDLGGCSGSDGTVITLTDPTPPIANAGLNDTICVGATATLSGSASGGNGGPYTYSWNMGLGAGQTHNVSPIADQQYVLTVTETATNCVHEDTVKIVVVAAPTFTEASGHPTCNGDTDGIITISATGLSPFQYSMDGGVTFNSSNVFSGLGAGTYNIQVQDATGCYSGITQVDLVDPAAVWGAPSLTNSHCSTGGAIVFDNHGGGDGGPYTFGVDGNALSTTISYSVGSGNHTIEIQDGSGCSFTDVVNITDVPAPSFASLSISHPSCNGSGDGVINVLSSDEFYNPSYSLNGSDTDNGNMTGLSGGSYTIVLDPGWGCGVDTTITLVEPAAINFFVQSITDTCNQGVGALFAYGASGGTAPYEYSFDNVNYTTDTIFFGLGTGLYDVYIKDANGCTQMTNTFVADTGACGTIGTITNNVFTPDGDGLNEVFVIDLPVMMNNSNKVTFYNRWGDVIKEYADYNNLDVAWDGKNEIGEPVPAGTYFFIVEVPDANFGTNGWVQVMR